jgi:hypothetical protein
VREIIVIMKDDSVRQFTHQGRAGGSYTIELKLEHGWAVVTDEWGKQTAFPAGDVKEIRTVPSSY